uniref:Uncharacterized protein n=1 Tax=Solanum lycopersicum TaxID=4081 RepID=A0A3Q7I3E7_SOLLC
MYSDADWGGDISHRVSTSDYILFVCCNQIIWFSKKQNIVSRSSTESEYKAVANALFETLFCPHEAVGDVVLAFKKSFSGPWHCWSKVQELVRDKWFNDFETLESGIFTQEQKSYSFSGEDKALVRRNFNRVGNERLSDNLGKQKRTFARTKQIPNLISQVHLEGLMRYWDS